MNVDVSWRKEVGSNQTLNPPGSVGSEQCWRQHSGILLALRTVVHHRSVDCSVVLHPISNLTMYMLCIVMYVMLQANVYSSRVKAESYWVPAGPTEVQCGSQGE